MTDIITRIPKTDGQLVRVHSDGHEEILSKRPIRPMMEAEIEAAAASDPDARPMTSDELRKARRVPRTKTLRRVLALTQEEFAARYLIPLGTLRDWEQGRSEPDQPARAYLTVIARDPEGVRKALHAGPESR
jgi:putative transcriptional regulator